MGELKTTGFMVPMVAVDDCGRGGVPEKQLHVARGLRRTLGGVLESPGKKERVHSPSSGEAEIRQWVSRKKSIPKRGEGSENSHSKH